MTQEAAKIKLRALMAAISERHWSAGWLIDLDAVLRAILADIDRHGYDPAAHILHLEEVQELRVLVDAAGGWWVWDHGDGPRFVPEIIDCTGAHI